MRAPTCWLSGALLAIAFGYGAKVSAVDAKTAAAARSIGVIRLSAAAPLQVRLPAEHKVRDPIYLDAAGTWRKLQVQRSDAGVVFSLPEDVTGSTVVVLDRPEWLVLPDATPPQIEQVAVGGAAQEVAAEIDLGHMPAPPAEILVTVRDESNPIAADRVSVTIDGGALADVGASVKTVFSENGDHAAVTLTLGDLPQGKHRVAFRLPDATPRANTAAVDVVFNTAPLLRNGGFEKATDTGSPTHWSVSSWDRKPDTKCDIRVVDGGRNGKALMIHGQAGSLNLVVGQQVELVPGKTYVLSGFYKNAGRYGYASLIGAGGGARAQYDSMPARAEAEDWTPFSWEATAAEIGDKWHVYLRGAGQGKVYFDDITLVPKPRTAPQKQQ